MTARKKPIKLKLLPSLNRVWELDYLRGLLLIIVTWDHTCTFAPNFVTPTNAVGEWILQLLGFYLSLSERKIIQPFFIFMFAFLSGLNCVFAKNHWRRATKFGTFVALFMLLYGLGTLIIPSFCPSGIIFNIMAVLAISTIFWAILKSLHTPKWLIDVFGVVLAAIGLYFLDYYLKIGYYDKLPRWLYFISFSIYAEPAATLSPTNFEPLLPSLGFFLIGGVLGELIYKNKRSLFPRYNYNKLASCVIYIGKHSLIVYFVGVVAVVGILFLLAGMHII